MSKLFSSLLPAYGRNYKSKAEVQKDLDDQKDFIIANIMSPWDGKPVSAAGLMHDGYTKAEVRYGRNYEKGNIFNLNKGKE